MRVLLAGLGVVGTLAARQLLSSGQVESITVVASRRARSFAPLLGDFALTRAAPGEPIPPGTEVVVIATPAGGAELAAAALAAGAHVVAALDDPHEVRALLALDGMARRACLSLAVGATMAPGLSCVLAAHAAAGLDEVSEVHVASFGTGGPACARRHHSALSSMASEWNDGSWRARNGGSGRELVWFPEPVGGADCYRAALADPLLLLPAFPGAKRVTSRLAATRRDRLTAPWPMMRRPHPEGTIGAVRVEVRGWKKVAAATIVEGASQRPALVAGTVAAIVARWAWEGRLARSGAAGLAELVAAPGAFLSEISAAGISLGRFEGLSPGEGGDPRALAPPRVRP